ncbi:MAG: hypothetical protein ACRDJU_03980, partial [Actinomycetota bacterium]
MRRVFQVVPFLDGGDAIGDHARQVARVLGEAHAGYLVDRAAPEFAAEAQPYRQAQVGPDDLLIYHAAHASPIAAWLQGVDAELVIDYHGVTPPEFLRGWDAGLAVALAGAQAQLRALAGRASLAIAHSEFMRAEVE